MKIGELAGQAGTTPETVRYYERLGLLPAPVRTNANYRDYTPEAVERLAFIRHARELGFELSDIRSLIELAETPDRTCEDVDEIANNHLAQVEQKLRRLTSLRNELSDVISSCRGGRVAECRILGTLGDHDTCGHAKGKA
jgi:Cu(I)-responsive transcriptional regulator